MKHLSNRTLAYLCLSTALLMFCGLMYLFATEIQYQQPLKLMLHMVPIGMMTGFGVRLLKQKP